LWPGVAPQAGPDKVGRRVGATRETTDLVAKAADAPTHAGPRRWRAGRLRRPSFDCQRPAMRTAPSGDLHHRPHVVDGDPVQRLAGHETFPIRGLGLGGAPAPPLEIGGPGQEVSPGDVCRRRWRWADLRLRAKRCRMDPGPNGRGAIERQRGEAFDDLLQSWNLAAFLDQETSPLPPAQLRNFVVRHHSQAMPSPSRSNPDR
jgi:hypothetical protein